MRPASSGSFAEVDARHDVRRAERDLLGLGEEVVRIAIQHHAADRLHRHQFLGHDLGRVEHVEAELAPRRSSVNTCTPSSYSGYAPASIASHRSRRWKSGSAPGDLHGLVPDQRMRAGERSPVELHETRFAVRVDEAKRVHAEALHHAVAARNGAVRHHPHQHVRGFGHQRHEIPERVVRGRRLRHRVMRLGLHGVDRGRETSSRPG